jgi:hypothetical protein
MYVTLDDGNGGIVRNLSHGGFGAQVVTAVRPRQELRVRIELRYPRLKFETRGEVIWSRFSGQCGIRFVDLSPQMSRQINEWIFGDLLEGFSLHSDPAESMFADQALRVPEASPSAETMPQPEEDDGLMVSATPVKVIPLPPRPEAKVEVHEWGRHPPVAEPATTELDWLSQPLSGRALAWTVHTLVVIAGAFLFALVFLAITGEAPRWPLSMALGSALVVAALYWVFFQIFGGASLGERMARLAGYAEEEVEEPAGARFR